MDNGIKSSAGELHLFLASSVHKDYINELDLRIEETIGLLIDPEVKYTGREYDAFRGGLKMLNEVKDLFVNMYECQLEDSKEEE